MAPVIQFRDDASRWRALETRDAEADGFFVYGVKSTKVYCRPICKARLARRANVTFYATGEQARDAGFRACKRCKPDLAGLMPEEAAIRKIRAYLHDSRLCEKSTSLTLGRMAEDTGLSKWHFHRVFKRCTGLTPAEYLRMQRTTPQYAGLEIANATSAYETNLFPIEDGSSIMSELGDCRPLSIDDLLSWPDDNQSPAA
jgi:methylphosphotriester-DNA--protein-cysteine methyltransferase